MPSDSRNVTISCFGKCCVPLNAMCSSMCASPRGLSSSTIEPTLTTSRSSARFSGRLVVRMK
ncbi:MAG: hypothetical protein A3H96_00265 [Acidobacteria bacterium RIFCSPLOWO2_02_FULL_67_36]|nr:MAG: hypothetical protein A3H96_00265 [Acidobacteria bacterium RIFCSPLOWO2_02_FULL_67_36]OFW26594.1 MAG: hypothetical protein A3G21_05515 [Acidobacteria bacterium RIFCSPLOWO2_12_FULL_66_21]